MRSWSMKSCPVWLALPVTAMPLLVLTACAGYPAAGKTAAFTPDPASRGVIVSTRHVMLQIAGAQNGVLGALGAPRGAGFAMAPATEVLVRQDNGHVMSVMEPVPNNFRPGERVGIQRGIETTLHPLN